MSLYTYTVIVCNGCKQTANISAPLPTEVRKIASDLGWNTGTVGGKDYCPECRRSAIKEWIERAEAEGEAGTGDPGEAIPTRPNRLKQQQ